MGSFLDQPLNVTPLIWFFPIINTVAAAAKSLQSCLTLCDPIDGSLPGSSIQGIFFYSAIFTFIHMHAATAAAAKSLQSRPTLCDPIDGSPPGSPVPEILQAR